MQLIPDPIPEYDEHDYLEPIQMSPLLSLTASSLPAGRISFTTAIEKHVQAFPKPLSAPSKRTGPRLKEIPPLICRPAELRARVHGNADIADFVMTGKRIADDLSREMRSEGIIDDPTSNVLDFGCGCGRVLRPFRIAPKACLQGSDIDSAAIDWATRHLSYLATFPTNGHLPDRFLSQAITMI